MRKFRTCANIMAANPEFAAGDFKTPLGASKLTEEWHKLKSALDLLGPQRSVELWKTCWRDQKRKALVEGGAHSRAVNATGNQHPVPAISDNAALVLNAIGTEMAVGIGPEESPIGIQQSPLSPSQSSPPRAEVPRKRPVRVRRQTPPTAFINAQLELNAILKDLVTEVKAARVAREAQVMAQEALVNEVRATRAELCELMRELINKKSGIKD